MQHCALSSTRWYLLWWAFTHHASCTHGCWPTSCALRWCSLTQRRSAASSTGFRGTWRPSMACCRSRFDPGCRRSSALSPLSSSSPIQRRYFSSSSYLFSSSITWYRWVFNALRLNLVVITFVTMTVPRSHKAKKGKENICYSAPSIDTATLEALRYIARTKQRRTYLP